MEYNTINKKRKFALSSIDEDEEFDMIIDSDSHINKKIKQ
jgi:hypothetical protein